MTKIIETSDNRLFRVWDCPSPNLAHCWDGIEVKRAPGATFVDKKNAQPQLIRRAATKIVREA